MSELDSSSSSSWLGSLYDVIAPETVDAITTDKHLRRTYLAILGVCADTSRRLAGKYEVPELATISEDLDTHLREVNANTDAEYRLELREQSVASEGTRGLTKRQGLFGGLLAGLGGGKKGGGDGGGGGGGGPLAGIVSGVADKLLGGVLKMSGPALAGAGFFTGVGIGEGAAQGLNLATADVSKKMGTVVAKDNNMQKTGLNPVLENAGMGLTATALKAIGIQNLKFPDAAGAALAFGSGLGNGAAMGLKLTTRNVGPVSNASAGFDIPGIANNLAFGASRSLTENFNTSSFSLQSLLSQVDLGSTALQVGAGLGSGAAMGLKLTTSNLAPPPAAGSDVPRIAGTFAFGLSKSVTDNLNTTDLLSKAGAVADPRTLAKFAGPAVVGFGKGLGDGAAVGLSLRPDQPEEPVPGPLPDGSIDVGGVARSFASGLTSRFLANGTATKALSGLTGPGGSLTSLTSNLDVGRIASGFGKGLGDGAAVGLSLRPGQPAAPVTGSLTDGKLDVGGIAQTFASGLTSQFLANGTANKALSGLTGPGGSLTTNLNVKSIVSGFGKGLGDGAAVGLNLRPDQPEEPASASPSNGTLDVGGIAQTFASSLTSRFLANGTANKALSGLTGPGGSLTANLDVKSIASGFGKGLGDGAAVGLSLRPDQPEAPSSGPPSNGTLDVGGIAQSFASGLTSRFLANGTATKALGGLTGPGSLTGNLDVASIASGFGKGLGDGAAVGLSLRSEQPVPVSGPLPDGKVDVGGIAQTFASSLTSRFLANGTATKALSGLTGPGGSLTGNIDVGSIASGFGKGLGDGAAVGLSLRPDQPESVPAPLANGTLDVGGIAQRFASGLTSRFLANGTATKALSSFAGPGGSLTGNLDVARIASGFGKGLGDGTAIGLGLRPDQPEPASAPLANGSPDVGAIAQSFASGLTSRFLANGTASKALSSLTGPGGPISAGTSNVNFGRVANGLARGLLAGVGDGVEAIGGVNALINGTATAPSGAVPESKTDFDDSVGGAATGFGQGLGSSGVVTAQKLFARGINLSSLLPSTQANETKPKRDVSTLELVPFTGFDVERRQADVSIRADSLPSNLNLSLVLSASTFSTVLQKAVDLLSCEGVGGLGLVAFGLSKSGTISRGGLDPKTTDFLKSLIPQGTVHVTNARNTYDIDGQQVAKGLDSSLAAAAGGIFINGTNLIPFAVFLALHGKCLAHCFFVWLF